MSHESLPDGTAQMFRQYQSLRHGDGPRELSEAELAAMQAGGDPLETMQAILAAGGVEVGDPNPAGGEPHDQ